MPLKIVKRKGTDALYLRGSVRGQGVYESTGTSDPKQAEAIRVKREAELWQASVFGQRSVVTFATAVTAYIEAEPRSDATLAYLERLLLHFKTTRVADISQSDLDQAYKKILTKGASASSATKIRGVLTPLRSVLEFAARRGWCDRPVFERPKITQTKMKFLRPDEAIDLVNEAAPHIRPLLIFLIGTGARMSEALELEWQGVDLAGRRAVVWQKQGCERHIDLPPVVVMALTAIPYRSGRVFRPLRSRHTSGRTQGKELGDAYHDTGRTSGGQIKSAWASACKRAGLPGHERVWVPKGQKSQKRQFVPDITPHALRHTFATWHYCVHKDLLLLKEDGGWQTITMVTRYAKKMPDHYREQIIRFWSCADWLDVTLDVQNACSLS